MTEFLTGLLTRHKWIIFLAAIVVMVLGVMLVPSFRGKLPLLFQSEYFWYYVMLCIGMAEFFLAKYFRGKRLYRTISLVTIVLCVMGILV